MENNEIQAALPRGTVLHGANSYMIEEVLGIGGFGITYLAVTEVPWLNGKTMRRRVAVKEHFYSELSDRASDGRTVSTPGTAKTVATVTDSLDDFLAEAKRLQKLTDHNSNIVKVFDVFRENGTAYYVMEYLEGLSLGKAVAGAPVDEAGMLSVMRPIIATVAFLHSLRINHLDIKPDNIVLADGGTRPVLIDFGQSKHFRSDGSSTSTVKVKGATAGFAPAEQYEGIRTFSPAADVYALGATMITCLTDKTPPSALTWQPGAKAREIEALPVSAATKAVITRALAGDPAERYADAGAMLDALAGGNNTGDGSGGDGGTPTAKLEINEGKTKPLSETQPQRRSYKWLILGAVAAILVAIGAYLGMSGDNAPEDIPTPADTTAIATTDVVANDAANDAVNDAANDVGMHHGASTDQERIDREREQAEQARLEAERRAEQERIERENQVWNNHRTPFNLYLAVERNGQQYFFSQDDWSSLNNSTKAECSKIGIVIARDGQRFILSLNLASNGSKFSWDEAIEVYGNRMPTKRQGEAIVTEDITQISQALEAFGGDNGGPIIWTNTEVDSESAWCVYLPFGYLQEESKSQRVKVRFVYPIY